MSYLLAGSAIVAALGAGLQYKASSDASSKQQKAIQDQLAQQRMYDQQATDAASNEAQQFTPDARNQRQATAEQAITAALSAPVDANAATAAAVDPKAQGDVSQDYLTDSAQSSAKQLSDAHALASLMGQTMGASRLRQNEASSLADTGNLINRIGSFAKGAYNAGQIGVQQAGVPDGTTTLAGSLLQGLGTAGVMAGAGTAGSASSWAGSPAASGGLGFTGTGATGLKAAGGLGMRLL